MEIQSLLDELPENQFAQMPVYRNSIHPMTIYQMNSLQIGQTYWFIKKIVL